MKDVLRKNDSCSDFNQVIAWMTLAVLWVRDTRMRHRRRKINKLALVGSKWGAVSNPVKRHRLMLRYFGSCRDWDDLVALFEGANSEVVKRATAEQIIHLAESNELSGDYRPLWQGGLCCLEAREIARDFLAQRPVTLVASSGGPSQHM